MDNLEKLPSVAPVASPEPVVPDGTLSRPGQTFAPRPFRVKSRRRETDDTATLTLEPLEGMLEFGPGQFTMLTALGVGEAPISISGDPSDPQTLIHTVRAVGPVSRAVTRARKGEVLGVRGPFGTCWPVEAAEGEDVVILAGGIGLAPLRPAIYQILARRRRYGRVWVLYGARTPQDMLYRHEVQRWRGRFDIRVEATVDTAGHDWFGRVGVVTRLIPDDLDPEHTVAMVCGPEIMMRFSAQALLQRGVPAEQIHVSMERNFHCGVGFCGHCQIGPLFLCKDGPVFPYSRIETAFRIRGL